VRKKRRKTQRRVFKSARHIVASAAHIFQPPERLTVSEAAEKYVKINVPGAYNGDYLNLTTPYMVEPADTLASRVYKGEVFVGPAQCAKALTLGTPLPTPNGWTTMGDVKPGDWLIGDDGRPVRVLAQSELFHGHKVFRVRFDDDSFVDADAGHLWTVRDLKQSYNKGAPVFRTITTDEIKADIVFGQSGRNRFCVENARAVVLPEADLPLDPYLMGYWLGDGSSNISWLHVGVEDIAHVRRELDRLDYLYMDTKTARGVYAVKVMLPRETGTWMNRSLRAAGVLDNKHLPAPYLRASEAQRRALLAGLMDSDGTISKKGATSFSTSSAAIRDGFCELLASLGFKYHVEPQTASCVYKGERRFSDAWRIRFTSYADEGVFRLARKQERANVRAGRRETEARSRFIVSIDEITSEPVKCIRVDNASHLFLAGRAMVPTHNTQALILNFAAYNATVDPMDMIIYCPTNSAARDFSTRRIDRMHRHSPEVGAKMIQKKDADNKFDKHYTSGAILTLSWPSVTEFAGRPIGRALLTDYDRMDDDIEGDGSPFDLASKRTTTFQSFAMTLAESSPSRPITNPKWIRKTKHEAPPTGGILALYNRGDKRRWYWPCPDCGGYFEGNFRMLEWDDHANAMDAAESVRMVCPHCSHKIVPDDRHDMQQWGRWVKDGQYFTPESGYAKLAGAGARSHIASFWLNGVAAAFISWGELVVNFLAAEKEYQDTASEEALKKFYNNDLGEPYMHKSMETEILPEHLKARAENMLDEDGNKVVPPNTRMLIATVDVQKNMWVVQVHAILPGRPFDIVVLDRFDIRKSNRLDEDGERKWCRPGTYLEDWDLLIEKVLLKTYPLSDGSGRRMSIKMTACDSGGKAGVTTNAYDFYRKLKREGYAGRFTLVKGTGRPDAPTTRIDFPDSSRKDRNAGARGDVPVLFLQSNTIKDTLSNRLNTITPGTGLIRFPNWLKDWFYAEMCVEMRGDKGWENPNKLRNEAWDLLYYCLGVAQSELIRLLKVDWEAPPLWASEWDTNPFVLAGEDKEAFAPKARADYDFAEFARKLA